MRRKTLFMIIIAFIAGGAVVFVSMQYFRIPWRWMPHGPTGMRSGMGVDRRLSSEAFGLKVSVSPQTIRAGEEVVLTAQVISKTAPHARTKISFFVDDKKLEELEGVIPPYQANTADFRWRAEAGKHTLQVILASAVGIEFTRWDTTLEVPSP
ncbi:MAG: hypothetical protein ACE5JU_17635 [Candidatus Binatia bacterium]